jgi:hypothetical protein
LLGEALFERDLHLDWYPRVRMLVATVRSGLLPFWDLSMGFGQPLLGDPSAQVLYPTTWLARPPWTLYTVYAVPLICLPLDDLPARATSAPASSAWRHLDAGRADGLSREPLLSAGAAGWQVVLPCRLASAGAAVHLVGGAASACVSRIRDVCLARRIWGRVDRGRSDPRAIVRGPALALGLALAVLLSAGLWLPAVDLLSRAPQPLEQMVQRAVPPLGLVPGASVPLGTAVWRTRRRLKRYSTRAARLLVALRRVRGLALAVGALLGRGGGASPWCAVVVVWRRSPPGPTPSRRIVRFVPGATHFRFPRR